MGVSLQPSTPIGHNTSLLDPETHSLSTEVSKETRIMSLHWTLIAGFLYAEIGALLLLLLPFISPRMWNKLIKSKLLKGIEIQFIYYFYVLVTILESAGNASDAGNAKELAEKLEKAEKDLSKALKDVDSMKTQSENLM